MNTPNAFDRYVESLLGELASQSLPGYLDDALGSATARPQRRRSILWGLRGRPSQSIFRPAMIGLPVVLALSIAIAGLLIVGGPDPMPSPSPVPTLSGTDAPATAPPTSAPPTSVPTEAAVEFCPGYADSADAQTLDEIGGDAWQVEVGPPPPIGSPGEGLIAAEARELPDGRPAVVLIDPATGDTCRLIDLNANEEVREFEWTLRGDALAISTQSRALVWSSAGLTELYRIPDDRTSGFTVAWAPTGEAIAVGSRADEQLRIVERTSSQTELPIVIVFELAWSPDGLRLHAASGAHVGGTVLHRLITGRDQIDTIDIGSTIDDGESVAGWLDNDTLIIGGSASPSGAPGFDAYDVASGTRRPWASTERFNSQIDIGYAPGLTALALFAGIETQNPVDLVVRELPSGVDHVLEQRIRAGNQVVGTGAWSPNGSRLAVSIQAGLGDPRTGVWLYPLDGSEPMQVSSLDVSLTNGAWRPMP